MGVLNLCQFIAKLEGDLSFRPKDIAHAQGSEGVLKLYIKSLVSSSMTVFSD